MDKVKFYKNIKFLCKFVLNIVMLMQVLLGILVLVIATYSFLQVCNSHVLDFLTPLATSIKSFMHYCFGSTIKASQPSVDGELVAFTIIDIICIFILSQVKQAFEEYIKGCDNAIAADKALQEVVLNNDLQSELRKSILVNNNYMLGITLKFSSVSTEVMKMFGQDEIDKDKIKEEMIELFSSCMKTISYIKYVVQDDFILISSSNFNSVDMVLLALSDALITVKKACKKKQVALKPRMAIDTYANASASGVALRNVKALIKLNLGIDIVCFGNFKNRYSLIKNSSFAIYEKGKYSVNDSEDTVYGMVKKG